MRPSPVLVSASSELGSGQHKRFERRRMNTKTHLIAWLIVGLLITANVNARGNDDRLEIRLAPSQAFAQAHGKAHFKDRGGERELEVELEDARNLSGQRVRVMVNGVQVGQATVNNLGYAELNLNSDRRENVPTIKAGAQVEVKTNANALVVSGKF
jgi:hypothetical protein